MLSSLEELGVASGETREEFSGKYQNQLASLLETIMIECKRLSSLEHNGNKHTWNFWYYLDAFFLSARD
jgi:hypothetical protein